MAYSRKFQIIFLRTPYGKHSPEQLKKQKLRAKRFGLDVNKNMEDGEIDDSEINPVGETLIMEMAKRIEDHNSEVNMENIDRMIVDKTLCVIGCNELHTKVGCP